MNNYITHALDLWIEITGADPRANTFRIRDFDVYEMNRELKESVFYDPTHLTTAILMKYFLNEYLENRSFTVKSVLEDYDALTTYLAKCRKLLGLLDREELAELVQSFKVEMKDALSHYGVERPDVFAAAENATNLAFLRRDALRSIETLSIHQFTQGEPDSEWPIMYKTVNQFGNIEALIQSACRMKSGISLNLISDPKSDASYFVFAYRNGGTVGILTDKPKFDHPMQKHMSRTRASGRSFMERIARNHFPYSLMDIAYGDNGRAYVREGTTVLSMQSGSAPMKEIKDLEPDEILWAIMMVSLIEEKMFRQNYKTLDLSYTGSMIRSSTMMLETVKENQLVVTGYLTLDVPRLTSSDVSTENMLDEWEHEPTRKHDWIEKRYSHKVPDSMLNTLGDDGKKIYLVPDHVTKDSDFSRRILPHLLEETSLMLPGDVQTSESGYQVILLTDQELKHTLDFSYDREEFLRKTRQLHVMDSTIIGTAKEVLADLRWTARYNLVKLLQIELDREYHERCDEVIRWYHDAVRKNLPNLYRAIAEGKLVVPSVLEHRFASEPADRGGNIISIHKGVEYYGHQVRLHTWKNSAGSQFGCMVNDSQASLLALFRPHSAAALAAICSCEVCDLPDILQHWTDIDPYHGNDILSRLDPLEWAISNPWMKLNFDVGIYLSKTGYNELRKRYGFPPNKFWIKPKEKTDANARQISVRPKLGDEVEFHKWSYIGHKRAPELPWIGVVEKVVREGRVHGVYHIKRHHDGEIVIIHGYENLTIPKRVAESSVVRAAITNDE
ncbi:hypothetical protein YDYSY3_38650 [Paenibacillus chitinolyticus]|uniref:hypothetical protein n=1 Tax=Paenibacillus chitinolyticus TaxID=79263 RepID=UPI0026E4A2A6|nr:hypothetical protein [Paenibacillus chitinolyticus]GKS12865.1 hypothetical protein YDYSY3_38650 [Paenibacillus chitinolyticus]